MANKVIDAERVRITIKDEQGVEHELPPIKVERVPERIEFTMQLAGAIDPTPLLAQAWSDYLDSLKHLIRERIKERFSKPVFTNACEILAEVINEELDAGFEFSDEQLERIAELVDEYPHDGLAEAASEWKKRV